MILFAYQTRGIGKLRSIEHTLLYGLGEPRKCGVICKSSSTRSRNNGSRLHRIVVVPTSHLPLFPPPPPRHMAALAHTTHTHLLPLLVVHNNTRRRRRLHARRIFLGHRWSRNPRKLQLLLLSTTTLMMIICTFGTPPAVATTSSSSSCSGGG